jgi:hypothetical protein
VSAFEAYIELASEDTRPVLDSGVTTEVRLGVHSVRVSIDVILLDPQGYVGRHVLWDTSDLTVDDAQLQAAPIVAALESELGSGRVAGVEVWHLRSGAQVFVSSRDATRRLPEVERIVADYLANI